MSASSPLVRPAASATDVRNASNPARSPKLTRPAATAVQRKPAKKTRHRIPPVQRIRVMQRYACGQNQTAIAREERLNRESIGRIVRSEEMQAFTEEIRERWRGLCDAAIQSVCRLIAKDDKQTVFRVLESNNVIPPQGAALNHNIPTAANPNQDERVKNLRACFADVMMERARMFKTPIPEIQEVADKIGVKLGFSLNGASNDTEEEEDNEI